MTSNLGANIIQANFEDLANKDLKKVMDSTRTQVIELLRQTIRPEFLNRIDETILFSPLSKENIHSTVKIQLRQLEEKLAHQNITMEVSEFALDALADRGYDPQFGARPLKRVIQKDVLNELSKEILRGNIKPASHIMLDIFDEKFVFRNIDREKLEEIVKGKKKEKV